MRAYAVEGSPDVFINGRRVLRAGDGYDALGRIVLGGCSTVFINSRGVGCLGDGVSGGGEHTTGSPAVFTGDRYRDGADDPGADPQGGGFCRGWRLWGGVGDCRA